MQNLAGKVAVVTGASKGMGRHFVDRLVAAGMRVACLARPSPELDALTIAHGDKALVIPCDVTSSDAVNAAITQTAAHFGRIDAVINNAAMFYPFEFETASDAVIQNHINLNILGTAWVTRAAIPHLRATKGHIVNISSESVRMPFPMLALYAATKAAVESLSQGLRDELRSEDIRVTVLRSGSVAGGSGGSSWTKEDVDAFYRKIVATGHASMSGAPASPQSMAEALASILALPDDICPDLIEVRAAREGLPAGAAAVVEKAA